ncbi:MAG: hypothetical protein Q9213_005111 [Squamulea squamosa]
MLAFLLASKALLLVTGFFTYTTLVDNAPAKALQAYLNLGLKLTIDSARTVAYSAPAARITPNTPAPSMTPSVGTPGGHSTTSQHSIDNATLLDIHMMEPFLNSTALTMPLSATKTHSSYMYLPALGQGMNASLPTALIERAQVLTPQSSVPEYLLSAPLPSILVEVLATELPFKNGLCIALAGLVLVIVCYVIWANCHMQEEARNKSELQIGEFWGSLVAALASNANVAGKLTSLRALRQEILYKFACSNMPPAGIFVTILDKTIDDLKSQQKLELRISFLETTVSEIAAEFFSAKEQYKALDAGYQNALSDNDDLRKTKKDLKNQNHGLRSTLGSTEDSLTQKILVLDDTVQNLMENLQQATTKSETLDCKCQSLTSENGKLQQINRDLESQNRDLGNQNRNLDNALKALEIDCDHLTGEVANYQARDQQLEVTTNVIRSERDEAVQELGIVKKHRDELTRKAETQRLRAQDGEKALTNSQEDVKRLMAENSELKTTSRDAKLLHKQEKEELNEQLAKVKKELDDHKAQTKGKQPPQSATKKNLEAENATLKSKLDQVKQDLYKVNEDSSTKAKSMEEQLKQAEDRALQLEDEAFDKETARLNDETTLKATIREGVEQRDMLISHYDGLIAVLEKKHQDEVEAMVVKRTAIETELEKAKGEIGVLAKQVNEQLTANSPSSQETPASFNTSSEDPVQAESRELQTKFSELQIKSAESEKEISELHQKYSELQRDLSARIDAYESKIADYRTHIAHLNRQRPLAPSHPTLMGPHPPPFMNMPGAYNSGPGGPAFRPMPIPNQMPAPPFTFSTGTYGFTTGAHSHGNGGSMAPPNAPKGPRESRSFTPGGQMQGINSGFGPYPENNSGPLVPPSVDTSRQGASFNPGAASFTPAGGN